MVILLSLGPIPSGRLKNLREVINGRPRASAIRLEECKSFQILGCISVVWMGQNFEYYSTRIYCAEYKYTIQYLYRYIHIYYLLFNLKWCDSRRQLLIETTVSERKETPKLLTQK